MFTEHLLWSGGTWEGPEQGAQISPPQNSQCGVWGGGEGSRLARRTLGKERGTVKLREGPLLSTGWAGWF